MPGRTIDTWTDSGSDPPDSSYQHQDSEPSLYGRHTTSLGGPLQYEPPQYEGSYGYQLQYPVTTGGGLYVDQQGPYSRGATSLDYQHYPPSPQNHLIPTQQQPRNYECATLHHSVDHHAGADALHQQQNQPVPSSTACLEMNYGGPQQHRGVQPQRPNPRQQQAHGQLQAQSSPSVYPAPTSHYGSPVHAHLGVHTFPGSQQQWSDYSTTQSRMISSPNSPSPAHTPTPPIASSSLPHSSPPPSQPVHSPPLLPPHSRTPTPTSAIPSPTPTMSGQYPAHQHHSLGPGGSSQGHSLSWGHANVANQPQALGLHQGGRQPSNSISPQPHNFYAPPMSSSPRGSQPLSCVTGSSPPPTVHSPPTTSVRSTPQWGAVVAHGGGSGSSDGGRMTASKVHSGPGGPGNPLASLQLLVDQDMNRGGGGGSGAGVPSGSPYRGAIPPNAHSASPSSIDLSAAKVGPEMSVSTPPPVHSPRSHLVYADGSSEGVRNGNTHGASSPAPLRPPVVNGEASSGGDSGIGSPSLGGGAPTPTPPPEGGGPPHISVRPGPVREPVVRAKLPPVAPDVEYLHTIPGQGVEVEPLPLVASGRRQASDSGICQEVADLSRSGFAGQSRNAEVAQLSGEGLSNQASGGNISRVKGIAVKRNKKVDAILENLVESGSKKLATSGNDRSSPVALVTSQPSVVVSDAPSATSVIAPTVVVSAPPAPPPAPSPIPAAPGEESTAVAALTPEGPSPAISHPPESPPAQSPENSPRKSSQSTPKSPSRGSGSGDLDDEAVSPTFDDCQGDKPRRKRKPDNPLRLKAPDAEGSTGTPSGKNSPPNNVSSKESSSSEENEKGNTQESANVKDPKVESAKEKVETPTLESSSENPKHIVNEVKTEKVDGGESISVSRDSSNPSGLIQNPDLLASPKTSVVEPKREKTTPKTKAEQKYVYRQYEVGDSAPPPKKLDFEQGHARLPPSAPTVNASSDSVKENERLPLKEELKPGCVISNSLSSCAPTKLNPSAKPASIKVEDVFGLDSNALESVVKKIDTTSGVAKVEGGSKSAASQVKDTVIPLPRPENIPPHAPAVTSSPLKAEVKNTFSEVEDQLAMMFAGIIEPEDGQPPKTAPVSEFTESKASITSEPGVVKAAMKILPPPNATMEVQEALTTPPSAGRKPARGRPKSVTMASAGDTSFGSIEGSPRKRKRKRFADDDEEDDEVSTPRRTKKAKVQGSATDRSPATVTPGSEGEGSGVGTSTAEATPNSGVKRKKKKKKLASESKFAAGFPREVPKKRIIVTEEKQPRGPYIRVEGPRDGPRRVTVVNVGSRGGGNLGEDEDGGDKGASRARGRRKPGVGGAKVAKDGSRGGAKAAAPSGTDSSQPDRTWVCVFCRRGSHADGLGDLFGPYFIGKDAPEDDDDDEKNDRLEGDTSEVAGKTGKGRRSSGTMDASGNKGGKKAKRRWSVSTPGPGFSLGSLDGVATPANPSDHSGDGTGNCRLEVWVHEECALWAAGLYQIGSRIVGLNEAVWSSAKMMCGRCGVAGANIGCVRRGCAQHLHYPCARDHGWQLDEEDFLASCPPHMKGFKSSVPVLPT